MPSDTSSPVPSDDALRQRILTEAIALVASSGIRGATLREVAGRCGVGLAAIATAFGNKDALVTACFAEVVTADLARIEALVDECGEVEVPAEILPALLWTVCEEAGGLRKAHTLVLLELLLATPSAPQFAGLCREWLVGRRDALRRAGERAGVDAAVMDIMGLHLLSEGSFAVSCADSATYGHVARQGFLDAALLLMGHEQRETAAFTSLATRFFADPDVSTDSEDTGRKGRGAESRARIVDAAASIIEDEGLSAITNRAVAERAGVSLALTTYHFKAVADLSFAGILRVFEKVNAGFAGGHLQPQSFDAVERFRTRAQPSGVERLASRGMVEISMAAARGLADEALGLGIRRQRGTITYAGLDDAAKLTVTRTRAASHALWSAAGLLISTALAHDDVPYDLEHLARIAGERLLAKN